MSIYRLVVVINLPLSLTFIVACTDWSKIYVCIRNVCLRRSHNSLWVSHVLICLGASTCDIIYLQFKMLMDPLHQSVPLILSALHATNGEGSWLM